MRGGGACVGHTGDELGFRPTPSSRAPAGPPPSPASFAQAPALDHHVGGAESGWVGLGAKGCGGLWGLEKARNRFSA